jgi:hypothetical protein
MEVIILTVFLKIVTIITTALSLMVTMPMETRRIYLWKENW